MNFCKPRQKPRQWRWEKPPLRFRRSFEHFLRDVFPLIFSLRQPRRCLFLCLFAFTLTMARPSKYTIALATKICERLMVGQSLRSICAAKEMPDQVTIYRWLNQSEPFRKQYTRAREVQADTLADEILDIADDSAQDMQVDEQGNERVRHEAVQRSKLRVDARKWLAGQLAPKKYGDRIQQNISGTHDGPIEQRVTIVDEAQVKATVAHLEESY